MVFWLVLAARGHLRQRLLFKGTNPLRTSAARPGGRGKRKDTALDSTLFFLVGSHALTS